MMQPADFAKLRTFAVVAGRGSFAKAAAMLGQSNSTVSQTIRALEERLGVRLFNRTTRAVALTEAGERLLERVQPILRDLGDAMEELQAFRDEPAGPLRLMVSSLALSMVIAPILRDFLETYPAITLDVSVNDGEADLVDARIHAGIRSQPYIPQDMIAVRLGEPTRKVAVASPDYLERFGRPRTPEALLQHNCVQFRLTTGAIYRWEFEVKGRKVDIPVTGALVTDNMDLVLRAAVDGVGIGYTLESHAARFLQTGQLVLVLEPFVTEFPGWFLYHPSRRQMPAPLKVFADFLRKAEAGRAASDLALEGFGSSDVPTMIRAAGV
jgi:DNA-binding transcriptional LysR family regulator